MTRLEIRLLGGLQISSGGAAVTGFISNKAPALLSYLAVTGRPHQREALAGLLWGEMPDAAAGNNLRQALTSLRKLAEPFVQITRDSVVFNRSAPYTLDVETFRDLLHASGGLPRQQRADTLRQALALYRGDFLEGFYVRDAPDFEDWALFERVQLRELALNGWDALIDLLLTLGDYRGAVDASGRLLAMDPWREEAHRQRMTALARSGQFSAALAQYQTCRAVLHREFEAEPSAETNALYERIRTALRSPRHNLPAATTAFVGREAELQALTRILAAPDTRLLTIVGQGGTGKTRLALKLAQEIAPRFLNGVRLAQLTAVADGRGFLAALADAVAFVPQGAEPPEPQLLNFLSGKEMLLVLDNFEHLIDTSAPDLAADILARAPGVKMLVTSRARLDLAAEHLFDLAGLPFPGEGDLAGVEDFAAVQLFVERSRRVWPEFTLSADSAPAVARICRIINGLPLAVELAAGWSRSMAPGQIADQLAQSVTWLDSSARDVPERHRSLAAVFEHSWTLLDETARGALARLSVCKGGFDRDAARAIAGAGPKTLQTLVGRSLLRYDGERFDMHPVIGEFAAGKLHGQLAAASVTFQEHARYFAAQAAGREHQFHGARDRDALRWMQTESDNIRAAWDWAVEDADAGLVEAFLESFLYFFDIQGRYQECVELTGHAQELLRASNRQPHDVRERCLGRLIGLRAAFCFRLGDFAAARRGAEEALALLEPFGPQRDVGHAQLYLGAACYGLGDLDGAVRWFLQATTTYEETRHDWGTGAACDNAGYLEFLRGNVAAAETHLTRALAVAERTGSRYLLTGVLDHLATLAAAQGDFARAMAHVERCRAVLQEMDRPYIVADLSLSLSQIALQAGDLPAAQDHIERALAVARETGNQLDLVRFLIQVGAVAVQCGRHADALAAYGEAATVAREMQAESLLVDVVAGLADRAAVAGDAALATTLLRFVASHPAASQETAARAAAALDNQPPHPRAADHVDSFSQALTLGLGEPDRRVGESGIWPWSGRA
ncbi:MAG TPA: BTAD domain-containing putative transcriptional regulator [Anaerolineae bacterium]|nr:BTAD domain-containing putative transcriptional regulator [Anaerolineae bacterium]